jgi:hypothetical protein
MHAADGDSHHDGAAQARVDSAAAAGAQPEGHPQGDGRGGDGEGDRRGEEQRIVANRRMDVHRGHAHVVHRGHADTHQHAAE